MKKLLLRNNGNQSTVSPLLQGGVIIPRLDGLHSVGDKMMTYRFAIWYVQEAVLKRKQGAD